MTKDELIDRVLLLSSHLQMALKEGETGIITIEDVELDLLGEVAAHFKMPVSDPIDWWPYHGFDYSVRPGQKVRVQSQRYKIETITKFI
jgi:hypothetical protein